MAQNPDKPRQVELPPIEVEITPELVDRWLEATCDENPLHTNASSLGSPVIPPAMLFGLAIKQMYESRIQQWPEGDDAVQIQYDMKTFRPITMGEKLRLTGRLVDRYVKRERERFVWEVSFWDRDGREVARYDHINLETYLKVGEGR